MSERLLEDIKILTESREENNQRYEKLVSRFKKSVEKKFSPEKGNRLELFLPDGKYSLAFSTEENKAGDRSILIDIKEADRKLCRLCRIAPVGVILDQIDKPVYECDVLSRYIRVVETFIGLEKESSAEVLTLSN